MSAARRLPLARYGEAMSAVVAASLLLRTTPFRRVMRWSAGRPSDPPAGPAEAEAIRRSVLAAARRVPWRALCFEQSIAASWLLRRRGLSAQLSYGAATVDGELKAHVWVRSGTQDVVGCENADAFALLARFPEEETVSVRSPRKE